MSRYASREAQDAEQTVRDVQSRLEGNNYCADCGHPRPEYINLTIGTFLCQLCSDIHRSMSNRRIKDMYAGDLTMDDARRMEAVGNDVANRKFLATWNAREMPEPDRRDKESLREFLWLKYEGSFKKQPFSAPPPSREPARDYRPDDRYYDDRVQDDRARDRAPYGRERDLFRESSQQNPDRPRGYWSNRYDPPASRRPQPPPMSQRDDYYRPPYPDRYRSAGSSDRFQPPQPTPVVPYGRAIRNARARYQEQGFPYEEYASGTSEDREDSRRGVSSSRSRRKGASQDFSGYNDGEGEDDPSYPRSKSSKSKGKSRRRKSNLDNGGNSYYSDDDDEGDIEEEGPRREKKSQSRKSKKSSKSKRRSEEEDEEEYEDEEDYADSSVSRRQGSKKSERRSDRDRDSIKTTSVDGLDEVTGPVPGQPAKAEFDLMSEWMGDSKDTEASRGPEPAHNAGSPATGPIPSAMQQAYATQVPMMAPPMSVYGGMMPMPGGGFMPMMAPGFMPGMGMPGMPAMPPGMQPGLPPGITPGMMGIPGGPGMPGQPPPMPGLMNGMQNLNLTQPVPQGANPQPPPPPPVGMPAGPAPGPPPEPPH